MAKKAKSNIYCDGKTYDAGKVFKDEEVAHLDQNDFEDVADEEAKVDAPKEGTFADEKKEGEESSQGSDDSSQGGTIDEFVKAGASEALE